MTSFFSGTVQGVGFRYTVKHLAHGFEVAGTVRNLPDGRVEVVAQGEKAELEAFLQAIAASEVGHFIRQTEAVWSDAFLPLRGFQVIR